MSAFLPADVLCAQLHEHSDIPRGWIRMFPICLSTAARGASVSPKGCGAPVTSEEPSSIPSVVPREGASLPPSEPQDPEGLEPITKRMRGGQSLTVCSYRNDIGHSCCWTVGPSLLPMTPEHLLYVMNCSSKAKLECTAM